MKTVPGFAQILFISCSGHSLGKLHPRAEGGKVAATVGIASAIGPALAVCISNKTVVTAGQLDNLLTELQRAGGQRVHTREQIEIDQFAGRLLKALTGQPPSMISLPGRGLGIDATVAQQHLGNAVTGGHQVPPACVMQPR